MVVVTGVQIDFGEYTSASISFRDLIIVTVVQVRTTENYMPIASRERETSYNVGPCVLGRTSCRGSSEDQ